MSLSTLSGEQIVTAIREYQSSLNPADALSQSTEQAAIFRRIRHLRVDVTQDLTSRIGADHLFADGDHLVTITRKPFWGTEKVVDDFDTHVPRDDGSLRLVTVGRFVSGLDAPDGRTPFSAFTVDGQPNVMSLRALTDWVLTQK